jgi:hypothetical protein
MFAGELFGRCVFQVLFSVVEAFEVWVAVLRVLVVLHHVFVVGNARIDREIT